MSDIDPTRRDGGQRVTASQFVRQFGLWQERAAREPVYIMHRGRPRHALLSIDVMEALCAAPGEVSGNDGALAALLDAGDSIAMILDREGRVMLSSTAARARFGAGVRAGQRPAGLALVGGEMLEDAIRRVIDSGMAESIEIVPESHRQRQLRCDIAAFPTGCLLRAVDMTTEQALIAARGELRAADAASAAAGAICVRLSVRGHITTASDELTALTGIARDSLAGARFASLFTVASRVEVAEAIEAVANDASQRRVAAECLVHGANPLPVTIGIAAVTIAGRIETLIATIVHGFDPSGAERPAST